MKTFKNRAWCPEKVDFSTYNLLKIQFANERLPYFTLFYYSACNLCYKTICVTRILYYWWIFYYSAVTIWRFHCIVHICFCYPHCIAKLPHRYLTCKSLFFYFCSYVLWEKFKNFPHIFGLKKSGRGLLLNIITSLKNVFFIANISNGYLLPKLSKDPPKMTKIWFFKSSTKNLSNLFIFL